MGFAVALAGWVFCASGCSLLSRRAYRTESVTGLRPSPSREVGRILEYDAAAGTALIEVPAPLPPPSGLAGVALGVRHPVTLAQTARVVVSSHRAGRIIGVYVIEGQPSPEDEVVRLAETLP